MKDVRQTPALTIWRGLGQTLGRVVVPVLLRVRRRKGKEDPARFREKMARRMQARPKGPIIWFHAASVGESKSVLPLIRLVLDRRPDCHVLITTGTLTSARMLEKELPPRAIHQFAPLDVVAYVRRFLRHWKPDLVLWVESEFWPTTLSEIRMRRIPAILVNARLSEKSFRGWKRRITMAREMMRSFVMGLAPTKEVAANLNTLGLGRVKVTGNLKASAEPLACDEAEFSRLQGVIGNRPVFVAASTHEGEDDILAASVSAMAVEKPDVLAIIVPRHPDRGARMREHYAATAPTALRSAGEAIVAGTRFYVADTMAELGLFYRLAQAVFVGGSLIAHGGQNPLEPAMLSRAVAYGPHMTNFKAECAALAAAGAGRVVNDADALSHFALGQFSDPASARAKGEAARVAALKESDALSRTLSFLSAFLRQVGHQHARP